MHLIIICGGTDQFTSIAVWWAKRSLEDSNHAAQSRIGRGTRRYLASRRCDVNRGSIVVFVSLCRQLTNFGGEAKDDSLSVSRDLGRLL